MSTDLPVGAACCDSTDGEPRVLNRVSPWLRESVMVDLSVGCGPCP